MAREGEDRADRQLEFSRSDSISDQNTDRGSGETEMLSGVVGCVSSRGVNHVASSNEIHAPLKFNSRSRLQNQCETFPRVSLGSLRLAALHPSQVKSAASPLCFSSADTISGKFVELYFRAMLGRTE